MAKKIKKKSELDKSAAKKIKAPEKKKLPKKTKVPKQKKLPKKTKTKKSPKKNKVEKTKISKKKSSPKKSIIKKTKQKKLKKKIAKKIKIPKRKKTLKKKRIKKTRTSKHKKPAKKSKPLARVSTKIPNFDRLIQGGFEKNSTNLLIGGSGSGKSIFATQFLIGGMEQGEKCLFVTFEEKKEQFYENMKTLGWDLEAYEKKGLFVFLEYTPIKVKTMLEEGGGSIESIILKNKISRVVIDSITSFALLFEDELSKREAALSLFGMIRSWNCTSLLTLEEDPLAEEEKSSGAIEFEVDSTVALYLVREREERKRYVEVIKMRGTEHSKKIYPAYIGKKGFFIKKSPTSRAFLK